MLQTTGQRSPVSSDKRACLESSLLASLKVCVLRRIWVVLRSAIVVAHACRANAELGVLDMFCVFLCTCRKLLLLEPQSYICIRPNLKGDFARVLFSESPTTSSPLVYWHASTWEYSTQSIDISSALGPAFAGVGRRTGVYFRSKALQHPSTAEAAREASHQCSRIDDLLRSK